MISSESLFTPPGVLSEERGSEGEGEQGRGGAGIDTNRMQYHASLEIPSSFSDEEAKIKIESGVPQNVSWQCVLRGRSEANLLRRH